MNNLNKVLVAIGSILMILTIVKLLQYHAEDRYFYTANVITPKKFPINIIEIKFLSENGKRLNHFSGTYEINTFHDNFGWKKRISQDASFEALFLPKSLYIEYIDYRSSNYYCDTITLPKQEIDAIFNYAKKNNLTTKVNYINDHEKGLDFHIGIANNASIIFWLSGNKFEKEFFRTELKHKPFPTKIYGKTIDKKSYIKETFKDLQYSPELTKEIAPDIQYKDSIPISFHYLRK